MADGSSFSSLTGQSIDRKAKRGVVGTAGARLPAPSGAIGAVDDPITEMSDADLEFIGVRSAPPASVAAPAPATISAAPAANDAAQVMPARSFAMPRNNAFADIARPAPVAAPREHKESNGSYASFVGKSSSGTFAERSAKQTVAAIKVVTRLVRGIASRPGTTAKAEVKTSELTRMVLETRKAAHAILSAVSPLDANRDWVLGMCMDSMADLVASRAENDHFQEPLDMDKAIQVVTQLFEDAEAEGEIASAIAGMAESKYVEADDETIAAERVRTSIGMARWDLYDHVMHNRLGGPTFKYTYDHAPAEIVAILSAETVRIASEMNIKTASLDARTMHMQGSIRRVANLIGAEYVARTRLIMNWISKEAEGSTYDDRVAQAKASLKTTTLPEIVALARASFISIETNAYKLIEDSKHAQQPDREHPNEK